MCYGTCKYEGSYSGECRFIGRYPADAACMIDDDYDNEEEEHEFDSED
jgi:hypothetical protein